MAVRIKRVPQLLSGDNFPAVDPPDGTFFLFDVGQTSFLSSKTVRDNTDSADLASARAGDMFRFVAATTRWILEASAPEVEFGESVSAFTRTYNESAIIVSDLSDGEFFLSSTTQRNMAIKTINAEGVNEDSVFSGFQVGEYITQEDIGFRSEVVSPLTLDTTQTAYILHHSGVNPNLRNELKGDTFVGGTTYEFKKVTSVALKSVHIGGAEVRRDNISIHELPVLWQSSLSAITSSDQSLNSGQSFDDWRVLAARYNHSGGASGTSIVYMDLWPISGSNSGNQNFRINGYNDRWIVLRRYSATTFRVSNISGLISLTGLYGLLPD